MGVITMGGTSAIEHTTECEVV